MNGFETFLTILFGIIIYIYLLVFCTMLLKKDTQHIMIKKFYNAVKNIHSKYDGSNSNALIISYEQLNLNYEKLCQAYPNNTYTSIVDILDTLIHYYDSYSDKYFKRLFRTEKSTDIENFMIELRNHIKNVNPFISIPKKEADLLQSIKNALENSNPSLGETSLMHLSQEIDNKEKLFIKQAKENKRASIFSIVGIILTIFFGILSLFKLA